MFDSRASSSYGSSYENAENARETPECAFEAATAAAHEMGWNRWNCNEKAPPMTGRRLKLVEPRGIEPENRKPLETLVFREHAQNVPP